MILPAQKYTNTTRTISGVLNIVYENDVVLLCDTSLGTVEVELAQIPANFWNTQYKLYVVDKSNNAGTNNIKVKAPTGFTVNNSASVTLNTNGADAVFTIGSNTNYLYSNGGTASTSGIVSLTYAALQTLISTNSVVVGQFYLVTNAIFTNTVAETVPVVIQGVTSNEVTLFGSGIFLNADYQQVGNYSGQPTFVANIGVWQTTLAPVIGNVVIWNNLHWINITGANGVSSPNLDATNWTLLPKLPTNGYIQEVDNVNYKVSTNQIVSREDVRNNYVENNFSSFAPDNEAFLVFQWGNNQVVENKVQCDSVFLCWNNYVIGNPVTVPIVAKNSLHKSVLKLIKNFAEISANVLKANSSWNIVESESGCVLTGNIFESDNTISSRVRTTAQMRGNTFKMKCSGAFLVETILGNFNYNHFEKSSFNLPTIKNNFNRNMIYGSGIQISQNEGSFSDNLVENSGIVQGVILGGGFFDSNRILNNTEVKLTTIASNCYCANNVFENETKIEFNISNNAQIRANIISNNCDLKFTCDGAGSEIYNNSFVNEIVGEITNQGGAKFRNNTFSNKITTTLSNIGASALFQINTFSASPSFVVNNQGKFVENNFNGFRFTCPSNQSELAQNTILGGYMDIGSNPSGRITLNRITKNGSQTTAIDNGLKITNFNKGVVTGNILDGARLWLDNVEGGAEVVYNTISGSKGMFVSGTIGSLARIQDNVIDGDGEVILGTVNGSFGWSTKSKGNVISESKVVIGNIDTALTFGTNVIQQDSLIEIQSLTGGTGQVTNNTFVSTLVNINQVLVEFAGCSIVRKAITGGLNFTEVTDGGNTDSFINNIRQTLDCSDPTIYDLATQKLTIPVNKRGWVGTFILTNAAGLTIAKIDGLTKFNAFRFYTDAGSVTFTSVAVAGAGLLDIVSSGGATTYTIVSHTGLLKDYIYITTNLDQTINLVYSTLILA
jgi:hypothetical protein